MRKTPELGTTVVLKYCDMTSPVDLSDLSFQWRKVNSNGIPVNVQLGGRYSVNHNGWLTIENVQAADLGEYRVTVSNEMGTAVHDVQLELAGVTTQPTPAPLTQSQRQRGKFLTRKCRPLLLCIIMSSRGINLSSSLSLFLLTQAPLQ